MSELPPRKRFQIHLSTAIVLMFVAGGLIWANTEWQFEFDQHSGIDGPQPGLGWPCIAFIPAQDVRYGGMFYRPAHEAFVFHSMIALDVTVALFILLAVWFICEWLIRLGNVKKET